jgi:signal transduction histidine kinase
VAVLLVVPPAFIQTRFGGTTLATVPTALLVALAAAIVLMRVRFPRSAVVAALVLATVGMAMGGPVISFLLAVLICVFSVARRTNRRTTLVIALSAAVVLTSASLLFLDPLWRDVRAVIQIFAFIGFAAAAGDAGRFRQEYIEAITERARRAEETKESEALRRVAEERLRIARDLHDVLAHQIAVINLHSNVAAQALRERPDDAEKSLSTIREAARTVLGEIGSLLSVLRASDAVSAGTQAPVQGLSELDTLIADFTRSGLSVDTRVQGDPYPLAAVADIVAYRVIQEALTNAHKHGDDRSALLNLDYGAAAFEITVTNTVAASPTPSLSGHGLVGVRERLATIGGSVATERGPGPIYRFTARMPEADGTGIRLPEKSLATPAPPVEGTS